LIGAATGIKQNVSFVRGSSICIRGGSEMHALPEETVALTGVIGDMVGAASATAHRRKGGGDTRKRGADDVVDQDRDPQKVGGEEKNILPSVSVIVTGEKIKVRSTK